MILLRSILIIISTNLINLGVTSLTIADEIRFISPIGFRVGHNIIEPSTLLNWEALKVKIIHENQIHSVENLPVSLNLEIIDIEKVYAFLMAIAKFQHEALDGVAGKLIYLNHVPLLLSAAAPTKANELSNISELKLERSSSKLMFVQSNVKIDCLLARSTTKQAQSATNKYNADVTDLLYPKDDFVNLAIAKTRRFRAAQAWHLNSEILFQCNPDNLKYKLGFEKAGKAVSKYVVAPSSGGMPG